MDVKKGQVLLITTGSYETYDVCNAVIAIRDFNLEDQKKYWAICLPDHLLSEEMACSAKFGFLKFLIKMRFVEERDYAEIHIERRITIDKAFDD